MQPLPIDLVRHARLGAFWHRQQSVLTGILDQIIVPGSRIWYLDYPVNTNVGDLLLYHGTEAWLSKRGHQVLRRGSIFDFRFPPIPDGVIIVCQGGGNLGDLYPHQDFREALVRHYPGNRIVFLPQTMHYLSADRLARSTQRLSGHADLHLLLRDRGSLALAREHFPKCNTYLAPDMAVMLYPFPRTIAPRSRRARLCLLRRDRERAATTAVATESCDWSGDWRQLLGARRYIGLRLLQGIIIVLGRFGSSRLTAALWHSASKEIIKHCACSLRGADFIETSRLHGHIFASLLGVPNRLHDNSYGKNSAYYRAWHAAMPLSGRYLT
jgi:pyruvyl transferase EpsO